MARCLICGHRYRGDNPRCGHEQPPLERDSSNNLVLVQEVLDFEALHVPGYRLQEVIGRGGFGVVLAAIRETDGAATAVKFGYRKNDEARTRLRLEAEALATIGPPHVPALYDTGTLDDGSLYLACERLFMPSLDHKLAEWRAPMKPESFVPLVDAMAIALEAAHAHDFVHRDLKPENIFIAESPRRAKLIDFGIVKKMTEKDAGTTMVGMAIGTPEYMAPEQCEGERTVGKQADIYALGVIMYEILTGRPPFFGAAAEVRAAQVGRRPAPPSRVAEVTNAFDELIVTCLAKDPGRRFQDVTSLRRALAQTSIEGTGVAAHEHAPVSSGKRRQFERMGIVFFETTVPTGDVKHALTALGGILASVERSRYIAVFGRASSENPVQRAFDSAHALLAQGMCDRALVDQDRLQVRARPDGTVRVLAAPLARAERYPKSSDPTGVLVTTAAVEMLPEMRTVFVRDGVQRDLPTNLDGTTDTDVTMMQIGADTLIGRDSELQQMFEAASTAFRETRPTITTVLSENGYGKSQLCDTIMKKLQHTVPMPYFIHLRCREPLGGESNRTLRELLHKALGGLPTALSENQGRELLRERLGGEPTDEVWYAIASILGWLSADAPEVRRFAAAPLALRSAVMTATGRALLELAKTAPVCIVLDDAHFADDATLDALEYATLSDFSAPIWVCIAAQPSFESARPSWGKRAAHASPPITLGPLVGEAAARLCRHLLSPAENLSDEMVGRLVDKTRGNPFLMNELARAIRRANLIRPRGRGNAYFLAADELDELTALPQVEWLAARELATLSSGLAAHARLVALLGAEVSQWEVEGVLEQLETDGLGEMFPLDAQVGLNRLQLHGILLARSGGGYSFRHQLIRDHVAQSTPEELRLEIHQAAFRFYRDAHTLHEHGRLPKLAAHAAASGYNDDAAALYLRLAEQANYGQNYVDAELMYTRALALLPDDHARDRMRAFNGRGLMRYRLSRFEDALDDLRLARSLSRTLGDQDAEIAIVLDESTVLDWMMDVRESKQRLEEARALAEHAWSPLTEARLYLGEGRSLCRFHAFDKAVEVLEKAAEKAEVLGDPGYETHVIALMTLGFACSAQNQPELAKTALDRAIVLAKERGDRVHEGSAFSNRAVLWLTLRDLGRAIEDGLHCLRLGRQIGQSELEYASSCNVAEFHFFAGKCDAAAPYLQRAVAMEPSNSKRPLSRLLEARISVFSGNIKEARRILGEISEGQTRSRTAGDMDALFTEVEELQYEMAVLATREDASYEAWQQLRDRAENVLPSLEYAELLEIAGLSAMRRSDTERAKTLLDAALAVCQQHSLLIEARVRHDLAQLE